MFIPNALRSRLGLITITTIEKKQKISQYRINGLRGQFISKDLSKLFNTSRVGKYMFDRVDKDSVTIPAFFALELSFIMKEIIAGKNSLWTSKNTAKKILEALEQDTWLKNLNPDTPFEDRLDFSQLKKFKYQPLPYQQAFLEKMNLNKHRMGLNGLILNAVMGSGKTMQALYIAECSGTDHVVLVVPMNSVYRVWEKTIREDITPSPSYWIAANGQTFKGEKYIIVHYEALAAGVELVEARKNKTFTIVCDESHNFNTIDTGRTQLLIKLCMESKSEYIVLQSGTPFKAVGAEAIPAFFCIDPTFDADMAARFKKVYAASAVEALRLLNQRLGLMSHTVTKDDTKLAPPIIQNVSVKFEGSEEYTLENVATEMRIFTEERIKYYAARRKEDESKYFECLEMFEASPRFGQYKKDYETYKRNVKMIRTYDLRSVLEEIKASNAFEKNAILPELSNDLKIAFKEVKTIYKYVSLKIQGECLGRILGNKRMKCAVAVATHAPYSNVIESTVKKTMVFTMYVEALKKAKEVLLEQEYQPLVVYADTNKQLNVILGEFEKDPAINPLVATFHSLSTAVPMVMADAMLIIDSPFRQYILDQAIARINRLGMTTQTYVYICQLDTGGKPNLASRSVDILAWSQEQAARITGVRSPFELTDTVASFEAYSHSDKMIPLLTGDNVQERFEAMFS